MAWGCACFNIIEKLDWTKGSDGIYERNGEKFHFTIQVRDYKEERVDIANLCSNQLKEAGVDMEVVLATGLPPVVILGIIYFGFMRELVKDFGKKTKEQIVDEGAFVEKTSN